MIEKSFSALRYLVLVGLINSIHFVGAIRPHTPVCDATPPPPKAAPAAVEITEPVCRLQFDSVSSRKTARRQFLSLPGLHDMRQLLRPCLSKNCWWYSSAGQNVVAGTISVTILRLPYSPEASRRLFDSQASAFCRSSWVKIADR